MAEEYLSQKRFDELMAGFTHSKIAVIGDFFLDEYIVLDKHLSEISVETGLEAFQVSSTRKSAGAAGTVTNILRSLEVAVIAIGFCATDGHGYELRHALSELDVDISHFEIVPDCFTPTYTKPMLLENGHETEQSRMDTKNRRPLAAEYEAKIIASLRAVAPEVKAILAVDQVHEKNCGVITDAIRTELAALAEQYPDKIIMADSREYMGAFKNTMVKFNVNEASKMLGMDCCELTKTYVQDLSRHLFERYHKPIILTLGDEGLQVTDAQGSTHVPAIPISGSKDIVGAGDSVMASMGAALSVGATLVEASIIGAITASMIVQQIGTTGIATRAQLKERYLANKNWLNEKITDNRTKLTVS
jgi:rfaE bifunctional protein kinase chain/domain